MLLVDMAHIAGLVATGLHPHPFPHAHVVSTTTYKSLRGARGGVVLWDDPALSASLHAAVFPGVQGSVLLHQVAGKAAALGEALRPEFRLWNEAVLGNARALAETLLEMGWRLVSGGTDIGLMLVDVRGRGLTGAAAAQALERAGIACNKNMLPFDPLPAEQGSGLRLSSNAGTTRGFGPAEFRQIGRWIDRVLTARAAGDAEPVERAVAAEVAELCGAFPIYPGRAA
jgi:glycine hydroxymethyltransferase